MEKCLVCESPMRTDETGDHWCTKDGCPFRIRKSWELEPEPGTFPFIDRMKDIFDAQIVSDRGFANSGSESFPVYGIGHPQDLSAGLYGIKITPMFRNMAALEKHCKDNFNQYAKGVQ